MAAEVAQPEAELQEGISTDPSTLSPTQVLYTHWQHTANYVHLMMESGISLSMGEG